MKFFRLSFYLKTGLLLFVLFISNAANSQCHKGIVLSSDTKSAIGYVNVGIVGKNVGTVADGSGNFTITLDNIYDKDSLRFSMIGYESKSFLIGKFKENPVNDIFLNPKLYNLREIKVVYPKTREIVLGDPVTTDVLRSGFSDNDLGSELGIRIETRGKVKLEDLNLNIATCTYDSVTYRLNIYQIENNDFNNILSEPIYITFSKDRINDVITLDLRKYSLVVSGDILISLELYKNLGEGRLLFHTQYFTGYTYHRKCSMGEWIAAPGVIGMYVHGKLIKQNLTKERNNFSE
jgi:hypothetical protein